MKVRELKKEKFRNKVIESYNQYLSLSNNQKIAIGIYKNGSFYVFGNGIESSYMYDIGSISKTITAHIVLKSHYDNKLSINDKIDKYLSLKTGEYPTIYELLTHSAGYNNLTPFEITVPSLLKHGYSKKNIYENTKEKDVIRCLEKRRSCKHNNKYGYSDFAYAILALILEKVYDKKYHIILKEFLGNDLLLTNTKVTLDENRYPLAINNKKVLPYWKWDLNNPYIAAGAISSNIVDMLKYIRIQIQSNNDYIKRAHIVDEDIKSSTNIKMCIGWHSYEKSNQLWHVGGVGTFRSSIIINKKSKFGVVVLGNTKGVVGANVHYLAKMIYSEHKKRKITLNET